MEGVHPDSESLSTSAVVDENEESIHLRPVALSLLFLSLIFDTSIPSSSSSFISFFIYNKDAKLSGNFSVLSHFQNSAMRGLDLCFIDSIIQSEPSDHFFIGGGLFLEPIIPFSFNSSISQKNDSFSCWYGNTGKNKFGVEIFPGKKRFSGKVGVGGGGGGFLSVSLSIKGSDVVDDDDGGENQDGFVRESADHLGQIGKKMAESEKNEVVFEEEKVRMQHGSGAFNTTKHLWAGAVAAMVSRTFVAPLERLKLEYIVRGEQRNLIDLIKTIATTQGVKGFWKGNFVNILRTAPFKAINFYAYDTYRNQLLKMSGNEDSSNFERFLAGASAGITATLLCLPMDTIRTKMVAPGGELLGGVIGTFQHMVQTEGFFSLYKGLVPSIISMAPSGAVFYGVYDILKSAYLHSPEGRERIQHMKQQGQELNALEKMELGTFRTLLYGAIAGACSEAATYPFEVVRRQLQMQVRETKLSALATCVKIVEQGGVPALYAGLTPSLLQVLPSAAISYFVYEFMKIVLKVESS